MQVFYHNKFTKDFNDPEICKKNWGLKMSKKIFLRLAQLLAVPNVEQAKGRIGNCHELKGNRKGEFTVYLEHPRRLIFIPNDDPAVYMKEGIIDCQKVTSINIISIEDHYKK